MESPVKDNRFIHRPFYTEVNEDVELDDWAPPDGGLAQKMVAQIEYYLSDENLAKDAFLLKHVRRNKMGYVNIKLLTSFKKMKHLTKDWQITAYALQHYSTKLELNEEGNKVRRKDPVPESLLAQVPSRLLLVWNVSQLNSGSDEEEEEKEEDNDNSAPRRSIMETAIGILEPFGTICSVRVFRPGRGLPSEVQRYTYRNPELCSQESVLIEYEDLESASRAYSQLSQSENSVKVLLVGKTSKRKAGLESVEDRNTGEGVAIVNRRMEQLQFHGEDSSAYSSSESEAASGFSAGKVCNSPWSSPRSSPRVIRAPLAAGRRISPLLASEMWRSPDTSPELSRRNHENLPNSVPSPWFQRRKLSTAQASSLDDSNMRQARFGVKRVPNGDSLPPGVTRFPHGPDGTRGFYGIGGGRLHYTLKI